MTATTIMVACMVPASWLVATACSSSTGTETSSDAAVPGDERAVPEPVDDAGAVDAPGDTRGAPCDVVKQDCTDPELRCQIIFVDGEYVAGCAPPFAPAVNKEGDICSRTTNGVDDCVKGLHCIKDGVTATSCRRLCAKDSDCAPGAKCGAITTLPPYVGLCWRTCTPFSAECPGESCAGAHFNNDQLTTFEACREVGSGALGSSCNAQYECGADMNCQGNSGFKCRAMCDDTHPCEAGTCKPSAGLPNNGGVCP